MFSSRRAASDIMSTLHGGSQTRSRLTSVTPRTFRTLSSTSGGVVCDLDPVDQSEFVDVDGNLRIVDSLEDRDDPIPDLHRRTQVGSFPGRDHFALLVPRLFFIHDSFALPLLRIPLSVDPVSGPLFPNWSGRVSHSVFATTPVSSSAARSACHASVAHFTLTGYSRTPAKTASLPSPSIAGASLGDEVIKR